MNQTALDELCEKLFQPPLDRLPPVVKPDWGGMATLLILAVTWGAAAWIMWTFREAGQ